MTPASSCRHGARWLAIAMLIAGTGTAGREVTAAARQTATVSGCLVRESDYALARGLARESPPSTSVRDVQLVLMTMATPASGTASIGDGYVLTGQLEGGIAGDVGRQVELTGVLEEGIASDAPDAGAEARDLTPDGAAGITSTGSPAHEPPDATGGVRSDLERPRVSNQQARNARPASISELTRLNVTATRIIGGNCGLPLTAPAVAQTSAATVAAAAPASRAVDETVITVTGCLERQQNGERNQWILTGAVRALPSRGRTSAVPGSLPSGTDSGTIGTSGNTTWPASSDPRAYILQGSEPELARYVARRVEVVGTLDRSTSTASGARPASDSAVNAAALAAAHPSAPEERVRVTSLRAAGGACK